MNNRIHSVGPVFQSRGEVGVVLVSAARVGHEVEEVFGAGFQTRDDAVVGDTPCFGVEESGQGGLTGLHFFQPGGSDGFEKGFGTGALDVVLDHVTDVEEGGFFTSPCVGLADGEVGILDGHAVVPEWNHFGAMLEVNVVEPGFPWIGVGVECWGWGESRA